ncbi:helix-turn-helix transcriptional regulator [Sphaerotilus sp.]|uniref:AraC family transcriptional regulator n=1 Tax=Sphaerotilus sp. TaxID=2093942 RepID=UPI0034E22DD5
MKPLFERVPMDSRTSCSLLWRELAEIPFVWHYHPEFELTLTLNAAGQRYVGDHLADFASGDLVLVGPNVAHTWSAQQRPDTTVPMRAAVAWFTADWLERIVAVMPELVGLRHLARRAGGALQFSVAAAQEVAPQLLTLHALDEAARMPVLLEVLRRLSLDHGAAVLTLPLDPPASDLARQRLGKVLDVLHARWTDPPGLSELAALAALSVGAFHRFFKRHTGTSVLGYVTRLRIGQACHRLIETDRPIGLIAAEVGYASLAQFNRQFLRWKGMTPGALRQAYRHRPSLR